MNHWRLHFLLVICHTAGYLGFPCKDIEPRNLPSMSAKNGEDNADFTKEVVDTHNKYRKIHGSPQLAECGSLRYQAGMYAQKLALMDSKTVKSDPELPFGIGENVFASCGGKVSGEDVAKSWYDGGVCNYFGKGGKKSYKEYKHFAQVVWKATALVGVSMTFGSKPEQDCIYVVVRYDPASEEGSAEDENIKLGNFDASICSEITTPNRTTEGGGTPLPTESPPEEGGTPVSTESPPVGGGGTPQRTESPPGGGGGNVQPTESTPEVGGGNVQPTESPPGGGGGNVHPTGSTPGGGGGNVQPVQPTGSTHGGGASPSEPPSTPGEGGSSTQPVPPPPPPPPPPLPSPPPPTSGGEGSPSEPPSISGGGASPSEPSPSEPTPSGETRPENCPPCPPVAGRGGASTPNEAAGDLEQSAVEAHNKYRKYHNSQPMTLNAEMSKAAREYSKTVSEFGMKNVVHSPKSSRPDQGENIYVACGMNPSGADVTKEWYKELCNYDYTKHGQISPTAGPVGHFTQVVWKTSKELGIGKSHGKENNMDCVYVVARYRPAGNYIGEEAANVQRGTMDAEFCGGREGTNQGGPEGANQGGPEGTNQGRPEGANQGGPERANQEGPEGTNQGRPEGTNQGGPEGANQGGPEGTNQGRPEGTNQIALERINKIKPEGTQGINQVRHDETNQPNQMRPEGTQGTNQIRHERTNQVAHDATNQMRPDGTQGTNQIRHERTNQVRLKGTNQMRSEGTQGTNQVRPEGTQGANQVRPKGIQGTNQVRPEGIQGTNQVRPKGANEMAPVKTNQVRSKRTLRAIDWRN